MRTIYDAVKHIIDLASVATMVGSLTDILPHVAAGFTVIWTAIRIWETDTVQRLTKRKKPNE